MELLVANIQRLVRNLCFVVIHPCDHRQYKTLLRGSFVYVHAITRHHGLSHVSPNLSAARLHIQMLATSQRVWYRISACGLRIHVCSELRLRLRVLTVHVIE
jgi:hypothetical protein